jgi:hypothetical protein
LHSFLYIQECRVDHAFERAEVLRADGHPKAIGGIIVE